jgi:hypothetical protein
MDTMNLSWYYYSPIIKAQVIHSYTRKKVIENSDSPQCWKGPVAACVEEKQ